ncbi:GntR family transcriptional regulator [Pollutimonas thiosulfatoxidans]|uniref:GntR family transcriptional regulator n=1 Tax=Pollutimonas thiosulfatoxidans TaxID=2028345 RepID=A0A410G8U4_9BURK|nr:GntR family transcriptional regulator [Pollutimonas thiosulfatoxidans]QAA92732.1 GntR family transcriptional regulator [Pollutimonas thiosulfatoxidans]
MASTSASTLTDDTVDRRTLPAAAAERLRELIIEGELPAGTRLNERALCDRLGVSRTPLREAFRLLASEGLVEIQPNRGARVAALSEKDILESFTVLGGLEALSGELACQHATDEEVAEIRALTFEMQACHARQDLPSYYRVNREIHSRINRAAHNQLLSQVYSTLNQRVQNLRFRSNLNSEKWKRAMGEHIAMVDALARRDGVELGRLMREHLQRKCEAVIEGLAREHNPSGNSPVASIPPH